VSRATMMLALLLAALPAAAQKPAAAQPDTSAITPAMVDLGRAIFHGKGTCFACHGPQLEGSQVAPTLKAHAWRDAKNGAFPAIFYVVTHGVRGTVMVALPGGISQAEALSVASYIWSINRGKSKP
jgi:mono/diheme cytochrome c family protein